MIQHMIVMLIVTAAAVYTIKRYAPKRLARKLGAWLSISVAAIGLPQLSKRIKQNWIVESPTGKSCGSGCGSCGACGARDARGADELVGSTESANHEWIVKQKNAVTVPSVIKIHRRA